MRCRCSVFDCFAKFRETKHGTRSAQKGRWKVKAARFHFLDVEVNFLKRVCLTTIASIFVEVFDTAREHLLRLRPKRAQGPDERRERVAGFLMKPRVIYPTVHQLVCCHCFRRPTSNAATQVNDQASVQKTMTTSRPLRLIVTSATLSAAAVVASSHDDVEVDSMMAIMMMMMAISNARQLLLAGVFSTSLLTRREVDRHKIYCCRCHRGSRLGSVSRRCVLRHLFERLHSLLIFSAKALSPLSIDLDLSRLAIRLKPLFV